jgi:Uma2 family endonuclease
MPASSVTTKRFTIDEYHRLSELGFFKENGKVELIRGELIQVVAKGTLHSVCNSKLARELERLIGNSAVIRNQEPIILPIDSEPEPDVVIVKGQPDDYVSHHPYPEDILLIIEVSNSTLNYDQTEKLSLYAENKIPNYWIINLVVNQLERYSQPYQDSRGNFGYRLKEISLENETVSLPTFPDFLIYLASVFPNFR